MIILFFFKALLLQRISLNPYKCDLISSIRRKSLCLPSASTHLIPFLLWSHTSLSIEPRKFPELVVLMSSPLFSFPLSFCFGITELKPFWPASLVTSHGYLGVYFLRFQNCLMTLGLFYLLKVKERERERGKTTTQVSFGRQFFLTFPPIFLVPQFFPKLTFSF